MTYIQRARRSLIQLGKILPFIICAAACISYAESAFSLLLSRFAVCDGSMITYKPLSWLIGRFFEYNVQTLIMLCVISISTETCYWNKLACLYLTANLIEKAFFDYEMSELQVYIICFLNVIVAGFLSFKGAKIAIRALF